MIKDIQILSFELGNSCNLSHKHPWCPSNNIERYQDATTPPATNEHFLSFLDSIILRGFKGLVAYHYYNEPCLVKERCEKMADAIHARKLKTLLWTNGTLPLARGANYVFRTEYEKDGKGKIVPFRPDDRLRIYEASPVKKGMPCYRPSILEIIVNYFGDLRLCCADWKGMTHIGNIQTDPHEIIFERWESAAEAAQKGELEVCKLCCGLKKSPVLPQSNWRVV